MKLRLLVIPLVMTLAITGFIQAKTGWEIEGLKGKVKEYTISNYNITKDDDSAITNLYQVIIYKYDNNGIMLEKDVPTNSDPYQNPTSDIEIYLYRYDNNGNYVMKGIFVMMNSDPDSEGLMTQKYVYQYDKKGNMIERDLITGDHTVSISNEVWYTSGSWQINQKIQNVYDNKGFLIERYQYNSQNIVIYTYKYKNDTKGNKIEVDVFSPYGMANKYMYKYDNHGNNIEEDYCDSNGNLISQYLNKYDKNDNIIEQYQKNRDHLLEYYYSYY